MRSRAAYLFYKLLHAVAGDKAVLQPLFPDLMKGLCSYLTSDPAAAAAAGVGVPASDRNYLFEAAGVLLAQSWVPPDVRQQHAHAIVAPLLQQLSGGLKAAATLPGGGVPADAVEPVGEWASRLLQSLASLSKGFTKPVDGPLADMFGSCLDATSACLLALPTHPKVRSTTLFVLHRSAIVLGPRLLARVGAIMPALILVTVPRELCDALALTANLISTFKAASVDVVAALLMPMVKQVFTVAPAADVAPQSDEARDHLNVMRR